VLGSTSAAPRSASVTKNRAESVAPSRTGCRRGKTAKCQTSSSAPAQVEPAGDAVREFDDGEALAECSAFIPLHSGQWIAATRAGARGPHERAPQNDSQVVDQHGQA